jgi:hypothetical protein
LADFKMYVLGFESSPYVIQWMRFDADSPLPEIVKSVRHVAFEVDDLEAALEGKRILIPPNHPSEGVRMAMIVDSGAPVCWPLLILRAIANRHRKPGLGARRPFAVHWACEKDSGGSAASRNSASPLCAKDAGMLHHHSREDHR